MSDGTTRHGAAEEVAELLRAGAVLPPGTTGGGDRAVPVFTRAYRHPGLDDRTVVRLIADDGTGDADNGFLGLLPVGEPVEVGVGQHRAMGFPEWVLVRHPSDGHLAMSLVEEMNKVARTVRARAKKARSTYESIGARLAGSVPHFLPTFYEEAGRVFLAAGETAYASQMFVNARKAETAHALPFDEARMDAVFLEFALADAMPTKVLSSYAKGLSSRVPAATAYRHLRGLFVRLAAHGVAPSSPGAADLRRLAKAAVGKNALAEEMAYLREVLPLPGTLKAPPGWWKAHRAALLELTRRDPAARGTLLGLLPSEWEHEELNEWLDLLERTGAAAGLADASLPAEGRSPDGTAGWLGRLLEHCGATERDFAPTGLYPLVDRMADTLRAELAANGAALPAPTGDVDLLDQFLALRIPVSDPGGRSLQLVAWAEREARRDLLALAADTRFHAAFHAGCPLKDWSGEATRTTLALAESPGGRPLLAQWVAAVCREAVRMELAEALHAWSSQLETLRWLPAEVLTTAEQEVRDILASGLSATLARTLRAGILDELGWPAWDEVVALPEPEEDEERTRVGDAWPHLIVLKDGQARVIGPEGTLLHHTLRLPDREHRDRPDLRYVDGALLVSWYQSDTHGSQGYWYRADAGTELPPPVPIEGDADFTYLCRSDGSNGKGNGTPPPSLPLPDGGRTTGHGILRQGDTHVPDRRPVIGDGTSYWVRDENAAEGDHTWYAYDPADGTRGEPGGPDWFREGLRTAPEGSTLGTSWLLPAPSVVPGPVCAPVAGLLGWRTIRLPDGSWRGEDLAGRSVVLPSSSDAFGPEHALRYPGSDRLVTVTRTWDRVELRDQEGTLIADTGNGFLAGPFCAGTPIMPPLHYWHLLQPRDLEGSAALRRVTDETAAALLTAAVADATGDGTGASDGAGASDGPDETTGRQTLPNLIRSLLPEVTHEALRAGIAGVVRYSAEHQRTLDAAIARLDSVRRHGVPERARTPISDRALGAALYGTDLPSGRLHYYDFNHGLFELPGLLGQALRGEAEPAPAGTVHQHVPPLKPLQAANVFALPELPAILALRAGSEAVAAEHREMLDAYLADLDANRLTELDPGQWRKIHIALPAALFDGPDAVQDHISPTVLHLPDGAFIVFPDRWYDFISWRENTPESRHYGALYHDPSGRFEVPAPYLPVSEAPFAAPTERAPGWVAAFRAELAERGPAPWRSEAAAEFARLTGVTPTVARLVVAGLPQIDDPNHPVPSATLKVIGTASADARVAKKDLTSLDRAALRAVVAALLPVEPSRLWTHGPDAAAAAAVWNDRLGRRTPLPEDVLYDAERTMDPVGWHPSDALRAFAESAADPRLIPEAAGPFGTGTLTGAVALCAWLAHRLPSGDPLRAVLPGVLSALRGRLADPGLSLRLDREINRDDFLRAAGDPDETDEWWQRHGAVLIWTRGNGTAADVRPALLDATGNDPYLTALLTGTRPTTQETALRLVHDRRFAELLADPGSPVAGARDADGLWWPQDPARSVPDLVGEAAKRYGLGEDAAALYLMLLALPDPTDRNTARWTGWGARRGGTARMKAARAELAATELVVEGSRPKSGRGLFLPGGWTRLPNPHLPLERWKLRLYDLLDGEAPVLGTVVPTRPVADLYREAWQRVLDGDEPRLEDLKVPRPR
ncbi:DNA-binding protein [Streptomyces tendae]|uniref:DNA-binding protein n=1 Tax=Streptomyces tendae TaxID=1932 RepID=UPI003795BE17